VAYGGGATAQFSGTADSKGRATLRFRINYLPAPGTREPVMVTVTATHGGVSGTTQARFYVKG
jgi:hypothetical protein